MSYIIPNAGWTPVYDLHVEKVNDPVKLLYKAEVYHNSGVKWNNIKLKLSTGNPNEGIDAPDLTPRYLSFSYPALIDKKRPGGRTQDLSLGGARTSGVLYVIDGVRVGNSGLDEYTTVDNSGINTSFEIELPYTIPSDGQKHIVSVKSYDLPATYRYFCVPKIDHDVFLQAQVTNWEDLNLLPAKTNIFFEGSYVGQGYTDTRNVRDTMNLSLGRDKKIIVTRERDKDLHSRKTIGMNERQTFAYTISVRNARKEKISLVLQDQIPLSTDKDIIIEDTVYGDADFEETTGLLRWTMELKPSELKKKQAGYTVKYPKGKTVNNLN